jgi:hypothetical protein
MPVLCIVPQSRRVQPATATPSGNRLAAGPPEPWRNTRPVSPRRGQRPVSPARPASARGTQDGAR